MKNIIHFNFLDADYWFTQEDIARVAESYYKLHGTTFEIIGSENQLNQVLSQCHSDFRLGRTLSLILNMNQNHWVSLSIANQNGGLLAYFADSFGKRLTSCKDDDDNAKYMSFTKIARILKSNNIELVDVSFDQQNDSSNCGIYALENTHIVNTVLDGGGSEHAIRDAIEQNTDDIDVGKLRNSFAQRLESDSCTDVLAVELSVTEICVMNREDVKDDKFSEHEIERRKEEEEDPVNTPLGGVSNNFDPPVWDTSGNILILNI